MERTAAEGLLYFQRTDEYIPYRPGPRSEQTFAEFQADAGPRAEQLPAVYEVLGSRSPTRRRRSTPTRRRCSNGSGGVGAMPDQDSLIRAARLMAQGTRAVMLGWTGLMDEQLAEPRACGCFAASSSGSQTTSIAFGG